MEELHIKATSTTPEISFSKNGIMKIHGKSIPDSESDFWSKVSDWFHLYMFTPAKKTTFELQIDYLNTSSSKSVLHLLYRLNELKDRGLDAEVIWSYNANDYDMQEVGRDYEHMVKVPFSFKKIHQAVLS
jgi:hypothetical protein